MAFLFLISAQKDRSLEEAAAIPEAREKLEKALALMQDAFLIDSSSLQTVYNLAFFQTTLGYYDEALLNFNVLHQASAAILLKANIKSNILEKNYMFFYRNQEKKKN